jgi:hypothetical protein
MYYFNTLHVSTFGNKIESQVLGIHCKISEVNRDATVDSDLGRSNSAILHVCLVNNPDIYCGARLLK